MTRALQWIGATRRYGDEDVWDFYLNSGDKHVEYVHFRDFTTNLVFAGWVDAFSESGKLREIVLREARVFDMDSAALLYTAPRLYIAREPSQILMEFPRQQGNGE